ncbi:MAG: hypothetical protein HY291_00905 [Planctomycetes bacterium]|nr:hypothetical protein [Planctomycetota bacterium]
MRDDLASKGNRQPPSHGVLRLVLLGIVAALLLFLLGAWVYHAFLESPEDKIRVALNAAAQGARDRNPSHVTEILSEDFQGLRVNKQQVHDALILVLMSLNQRIDVAMAPEPIPVTIDPQDPNKAEAVFRVRVRGKATPESNWLEIKPPNTDSTQFHCRFKLTEKGWKMYGLSITE